MNLQQLIDEKIALGNKLIDENEGLDYMTFTINNIDPLELKQYAEENKRDISCVDNKMRVLVKCTHPTSIFLESKPVKINTQISYELL